MENVFPLQKGLEVTVTVSALLNRVINGALGHRTDRTAGGGGGAGWINRFTSRT